MCSANDICKESNRQTLSAEDVFKALDDIEFSEFVAPLRASLQGQQYILKLKLFVLYQSVVLDENYVNL